MNDNYLKYLFKNYQFDYVIDYAIMCSKIIIENHINKIADGKMSKMQVRKL